MAIITMFGTEGDDTLSGENGHSYQFNGFAGNDTLIGADGNDEFHGGAGADVMSGGDGNDLFIYGDSDLPLDDVLDGGDGIDTIRFDTAAETNLFLMLTEAMRANIEEVLGGDGNELFSGYSLTSSITLSGGAGIDVLESGSGNDTLIGGDGNDTLKGNGGADSMFGGAGDDSFIYWTDQTYIGDFISGGDGFDTVTFYSEAGVLSNVTVDTAFSSIERMFGGDGDETFDASSMADGIIVYGGDGNDALIGGAGNDILSGDDGIDTLKGGGGDDSLIAGAGNDNFIYWIDQTHVGDFISGGDGFDTVTFFSEAGTVRAVTVDTAFSSIERIFGGDGDDSFDASSTADGIILYGGSGNDVLIGGAGNDTLSGDAGNDVLSGGDGDDTIDYLPGDTPVGDTIDGGDGFDTIRFNTPAGADLFLTLTDAMRTNIEQVSGSDGNELFSGYGLTSSITLSGGAGNDALEGGSGNDILLGNEGNDTLKGNGGGDSLIGGAGDDSFIYWTDQTHVGDFLDGDDGFDTVTFYSEAGAARAVTLGLGFSSIERVFGGDGDDSFDASSRTDGIILDSGNGNDVLTGGTGADTLVGGAGNDTLKGNSGYNTLIGGAGDDIFVMQGSDGTWTVTDFSQGQDHIQIVSDTPLDFAWVQAHAVQEGDDTHISINGSMLILQHIGVASLLASDFIF